MKLTVDVTDEDVQAGQVMCPGGCPVALAAQRAGVEGAEVRPYFDAYTILGWQLTGKLSGVAVEGTLSEEVGRRIEIYDRRHLMSHFSFSVELDPVDARASG